MEKIKKYVINDYNKIIYQSLSLNDDFKRIRGNIKKIYLIKDLDNKPCFVIKIKDKEYVRLFLLESNGEITLIEENKIIKDKCMNRF